MSFAILWVSRSPGPPDKRFIRDQLATTPLKNQVAPGTGKLKRALETADKIGARAVLIIGDDEIAAGTYTLKTMKTGEQEKLSREQLIERFQCQTR